MTINVKKIALNEGFKDAVMNITPPVATLPCDGFPFENYGENLKLPQPKEVQQQELYCGDEYVYEEYDMSKYPEAANAEKGHLRAAENLDAYFWSTPKNIRKKLGQIFHEKSRERRKESWNIHCKQRLAKKIGPGSFYPNYESVEKNSPAYTMVGPLHQAKTIRYPGPAEYMIKREPINEKFKSCSFKGPNWLDPEENYVDFYDTSKYKALGTEPKHTFFGNHRKCRRQYPPVYNEQLYKPIIPSKIGWTFGLKNEIDEWKVENYYRAVSPSVVKRKTPYYSIVGDRYTRKGGMKYTSSPADFFPNLSYKPNAPKYSMKFEPKIFKRDRFGDIKEVKKDAGNSKYNLGPGSYNIPLDTNDFRGHLFNYRFHGSCILQPRDY
ncbi:hypothetical protein SNEBB_003564 [Seison nebaliae]|nr:hypothetical protein SNEBB_003564 [Seison nebaliae]